MFFGIPLKIADGDLKNTVLVYGFYAAASQPTQLFVRRSNRASERQRMECIHRVNELNEVVLCGAGLHPDSRMLSF